MRKRTAGFWMPVMTVAALVLLFGGGAAAARCQVAGERSDDGEQDVRDLAARVRIGLGAAIEKALEARPGAAVEAELEAERTSGGNTAVFFEVDVVADGALHEVSIDARSGEVLGQEVEDDRGELRAGLRVLRHTELGLADLVASAEKVVKGRAVGAALEMERWGPECEVLIVNGRYLIEAGIEGRAGHLVELELEGGFEEDDDEDEDDEYEHEHDEDEDDEDDDDDR